MRTCYRPKCTRTFLVVGYNGTGVQVLINSRMEKVKSYAITIRPRDGISEQQITKFCNYVTRKSIYYHVVTEGTMADRHIHAGVVFHKAAERRNVINEILRLYPELDAKERTVLRAGIKIMYNNDWINKYTEKNGADVEGSDGTREEIISCLPESRHLDAYFPPKPEAKSSEAKRKEHNKRYQQLEKLWFQYQTPGTEVNTPNCRAFLARMMYKENEINIPSQDKEIIQMARHLTRWLCNVQHDVWELAPFEKEESYE